MQIILDICIVKCYDVCQRIDFEHALDTSF